MSHRQRDNGTLRTALRLAVDPERRFLNLGKAQVMGGRVGESFAGVVSLLAAFGVFLEDFVHVSNLRDKSYIHDAGQATLRGRGGRRQYGG